ncbi:MAG: ATP-binding protein [Enhygromyxa sp.]
MAQGNLLRQLVRAGARSGDAEFVRAAEQVIEEERAKRHHLLANDLERILYGEVHAARARPSQDFVIPQDQDRGLPLLDVLEPLRGVDDIVLTERNERILNVIIEEHARADVLGSWGLRPIGRVLLCGPPGCGKTLASEVLATELGLPLAIVRFDAVVSSLLGETAANLRKVLDFLTTERVVALFDEFDAIGKTRDDASEHGELRRVVNAFLQMLDGYRGRSLILAATNHEGSLDVALLRRFDEVMRFGRPDVPALRQLLDTKLRSVRRNFAFTDDEISSRFLGMSHADVERVLIRAIKSTVLAGAEKLQLPAIDAALERESERRALFDKLGSQ